MFQIATNKLNMFSYTFISLIGILPITTNKFKVYKKYNKLYDS